jgi:oligoribonuclease NrnB/cAMP/cGMP phosphodiesterase (DHH superfamily)
MKDIIVFYHKNCLSGIASAWVVYTFFGEEAEYIEMDYKDPIPEMENKIIYFVDFSTNLEKLKELCEKNIIVTVIDHHSTFLESMNGIQMPSNFTLYGTCKHSGCVLTWEYFYPPMLTPQFLQHIEDRELCNFKLNNTKEIYAAFYMDKSFDYFTMLLASWADIKNNIIEKGRVILKTLDNVKESAKKNTFPIWMYAPNKGEIIEGIGCFAPPIIPSELGNELCLKHNRPYSVIFNMDENGIIMYLNSIRVGKEDIFVDVSQIAQMFNGGGHKTSAVSGYISIEDFKEITKKE